MDQLDILQCELEFLSEIEKQATTSDELPLLSKEAPLLERALTTANDLMSSVWDQFGNCQFSKPGTKARLQWALKGKAHADELLTVVDPYLRYTWCYSETD